MSGHDNGGPAFPVSTSRDPTTGEYGHQDGNTTWQCAGITTRDYFAAKAMQGMLAVPDDRRYGDRSDKALSVEEWQKWCVDGLVEHSYRVADAMLRMKVKP